jgi:hypothetical protein
MTAPVSASSIGNVPLGRRKHIRFPVALPVEYTLDGARRQSLTANLSRGGLFLWTDDLLPVGQGIRLSIDWPVLLDRRCGLRLSVSGSVVRAGRGGIAVRIERYEFRVCQAGSVHHARTALPIG